MSRAIKQIKRRKLRFLLMVIVIGTVAGAALAYFTSIGTGSGSGSVGTLNAPTGVTASATAGSSTVSVSWTAPSGGTVAPSGYYVTRIKNSDSSTAAACGTSPSSTTATTSCLDSSVPDGSYHYTVTAVYRTWTATSAASNNVTVQGDNGAPTTAISFPANAGSYNLASWSNECAGGLVTGICGSASDPSAVASVKVAIRNGAGLYWNGSGFSGTSANFQAASGTTNWSYGFTPPADGSYTVYVQATDGVGNTTPSGAETTAAFTYDTTTPSATVTAVSSSPTNAQPLSYSVAFSEPVSDLTSAGINLGGTANETSATLSVSKTDSQHFTVSVSGLKTDGTGDGTVTVQVKANAVSDAAGNNNTASNTASVAWDRTAPTVTAINRHSASPTNAASVQWDVSFSESVSGVSASNFTLVNSGLGGTPAITSVTGSGTSWTVTASTGSGDGSLGLNESSGSGVSDSAGNGLSGSFTGQVYTIDHTAPTVAVTQVNGATRTFPYATNAASVTSIGGSCGSASGDGSSVSWSFGGQSGTVACNTGSWSATFTSVTAEGSYSAQASQSDTAGNTGSNSKSVILDRTAPTNSLSLVNQSTQAGPDASTNPSSFLSGGTLWYAGGTSGGFKLQNALTDSLSGPASSTFGALGGAATGWSFTGSTVSTPSGGPYLSNQLSWNACGVSTCVSPTEGVSGTDAAGNSNTGTMLTLRNDSTAPTAALSFPASNGNYNSAAWGASICASAICGTATDPGTNGTNPPSFGAQSSQQNGSATNSLTLTTPASTATGDVLIAAVTIAAGNSTTITAPSGWTPIRDLNSGSSVRVASYYHVVTGSEPANYTWGFNGSVTGSGGIVRYTGVDTSNPIDVSNANSGNTGTSVTAPSVTTSGANDLIVGLFASQQSTSFTPPTGMSERYDVTNASGPATEAADVTQASAGATGDKTATAGASANWVAQLVALRAAPPNISGLGKVQVSVQATSGANSGKYWDPAGNGGLGGFTSASEVLLLPSGTTNWLLPFPSSNFSDGTYTVKAYAVDNVGNFASAPSASFTIDNVAPTPTLTAPASGSVISNTRPTFSGAAATASGDLTAITIKVYSGTGTGGTLVQTLSATASAGSWSVTPTAAQALADGTYTAQASQSDAAGNSGTSAAVTFTVNTSAPTLTSKPSSPSANTGPSFGFSHSVYTSFQCSLDGAAFAACTSPKALSGLSNASHTFAVKALDSLGNATQTASYTWTVNTSAPTISAKPANPSATSAPSFSFSQSSYSSYECSLDGGAFASCTSPKTYSTADGSHTFSVKALDADGVRTSAASYSWTQTTTAPSITAKPASTSANKTPSFSFSETGYSSFQCQVDTGSFASCTSPFTTATLADGSHSFNVRAVDGNGVTTASVSYTWTVNTTAPTISSTSGMTAGGTYASTSASFSFSQAVFSSFQCFLDGGSFATCTSPKTFSGLADGSHTVTAAATDTDGVNTSNATFQWTVKNAAPTISSQPANPTNSTSATFNFNETPYTLFQCQRDGGSFIACNPGTVSYTSLTGGAGTTHTFKVHAVDSMGISTADQTYTWVIDTQAPSAPTGLAYVDNNGGSADFVTGTAEANATVTATETAGPHVNSTYTATVAANGSFTISVDGINGNSSGTSVTYSVTAKDAAGNISSAATITATDRN